MSKYPPRRGWGIASGGTTGIQKGPADYFKLGDWNARCDECYLKCKANDMFLRWDNARVCSRCIEIRNPQDYVRGIPDNPSVPWARPTPPPRFVSGNGSTTTPASSAGIMTGGVMTGGCMTG